MNGNEISSTAMVLAAGLGMRMRPLSLTKPKPLQIIGDQTMLDHALDKLVAAGVKRAVVNTHYLAEQIEAHLAKRADIEILFSREAQLLDTGGGIANALTYFDGKPFFALNADMVFFDGKQPSFDLLRHRWNPMQMDVLLLLMQSKKALGFDSLKGDFLLSEDGRVSRKGVPFPRPFVCLATQIVKPEVFSSQAQAIFSNNLIWDQAEQQGRLFGLEHEGTCYHVGTPEDLENANRLLATGQGWGV